MGGTISSFFGREGLGAGGSLGMRRCRGSALSKIVCVPSSLGGMGGDHRPPKVGGGLSLWDGGEPYCA